MLLLEWCERKTLLAGWWLEAAAVVVWEENTVGWCWSRTVVEQSECHFV